MKKSILLLIFVVLVFQLFAYTERNWLTQTADLTKIKEMLVMNQKWVPYPNYFERAAWVKFSEKNQESLIREGEKFLKYE